MDIYKKIFSQSCSCSGLIITHPFTIFFRNIYRYHHRYQQSTDKFVRSGTFTLIICFADFWKASEKENPINVNSLTKILTGQCKQLNKLSYVALDQNLTKQIKLKHTDLNISYLFKKGHELIELNTSTIFIVN